MNKLKLLTLLIGATFIAPSVIVLAEWSRTVLGFFNLAPSVAYMPNGFENFYLFIVITTLIIGVPISSRLLSRGELRLTKHVQIILAILIFWKVIDVTLMSQSPAVINGTAASLVMSLGTFGYGIIAGTVFWFIGVRPHTSRDQTKIVGASDQ